MMISTTKNRNKNQNRNQLMVAFKGLKYGAFAGFIATWSISSVIVVTELLLGLQIGAFYSTIPRNFSTRYPSTSTSYLISKAYSNLTSNRIRLS